MGANLDWDRALPRLLQEGLVRRNGDLVVLTALGRACRERAERAYPFVARMYDTYFSCAAASRVHAAFCELVYGRNLCQHGVADMAQVDALAEVLGIRREHWALDLGCGNGMISEYVSDATGAHITGIDASRAGINQAVRRTEPKRRQLMFKTGNLNTLVLPKNAFDAVLLIDTIYFLDRESIIRRAAAALRPGGRLGLYYSHWWSPGDSPAETRPETTDLAELLHRCGLSCETLDFSATEDGHWQKKLEVLEKQQPEFEAESNGWLHGFRQREAKGYFQRRSHQECSRYLYHAWPRAA